MKTILGFLLVISFISLTTAMTVNIPVATNYSLVNVNNSQYLQSLTPQQVADLFDASPYWKNDGSATATGDWDIGAFDFTATNIFSDALGIGTTSFGTGNIFALTGSITGGSLLATTGTLTSGSGTISSVVSRANIVGGSIGVNGFNGQSSTTYLQSGNFYSVYALANTLKLGDGSYSTQPRVGQGVAGGGFALFNQVLFYPSPYAPSIVNGRTGGMKNFVFGYQSSPTHDANSWVYGMWNFPDFRSLVLTNANYAGFYQSDFNTDAGSRLSKAYGVYLEKFTLGTTKWGIYDTGNNWAMASDNSKFYQGAGQDFSMTYNGTDAVLNPKEVGTGKLFVLGDLAVQNNFTGNQIYGEMWFHNDTNLNVTAIGSAGVWYNISALQGSQNTNNQTLNGFSFSNGSLISQVTGLYQSNYCISGTTGNSNRYHFALAINEVIQLNTEQHSRTTSGGDSREACGTGFISLTEGQYVTLMVLNDDTANDISINSVNVNLMRIGD